MASKNAVPEDQALVITRGNLQIPMTKIRKSKQSLFLEGFGHAQRRLLPSVLDTGI
jgi:hypothetical protein